MLVVIDVMIPEDIRKYLDERGVSFHELPHAHRATAQGTASCAHISGKRFAKTIVLKRDGQFLLAVVPANEHVDLRGLGALLGGRVELAREEELVPLFPDCEAGAMPPLGGLYGLPVVADSCLARQRTIAVNGGTHEDLIELDWEQYVALEHPRVVEHAPPR
jgi:Ala-tRNA(Pro) deacylase